MKELQKLLSSVRQATEHYGMISPGDRIAVGLSGGKDSMALLLALRRMQDFSGIPFELSAVSVDAGFPGSAAMYDGCRDYCRSLGVPYAVEKTEIATIVFGARQEKNPCSLCAKMRRGALTDCCRREGWNKLALGHHLDDAVETFMMSLLVGGRIGCFCPVTVYDDCGIRVIRPMIYAREYEIAAAVRAEAVPVVKNPCPMDHQSERERMKTRLRELEHEYHGLYERVIGAMERGGIDDWFA